MKLFKSEIGNYCVGESNKLRTTSCIQTKGLTSKTFTQLKKDLKRGLIEFVSNDLRFEEICEFENIEDLECLFI